MGVFNIRSIVFVLPSKDLTESLPKQHVFCFQEIIEPGGGYEFKKT
jgi:hypothetical protein